VTAATAWIAGARPRTLPAALAPVAVGTGAAQATRWWAGLLALVVSLALQVAVNYANDYSDGVRGTDAGRVGPFRLVGSGAASPAAVRAAALGAFGVAAAAGLVLVALTRAWELLAVGAACILAAWYYTGGSRPYGYRGLGEVAVFVFFGLVAVTGTTYVHSGSVPGVAVAGGVACGALACAILVANNLRDIPTDRVAGKRTLAVLLGDARTRLLYAALLALAFAVPVALAPARPLALLALLALPLAVPPLRLVRGGARGLELVAVLGETGRLQLIYALLLAAGLAWGR